MMFDFLWKGKRRLYWSANVARSDEGRALEYTDPDDRKEVFRIEDANIIGSQSSLDQGARRDWHYPVLDIDFQAYLLPSKTPGHFHLYLEKAVPHDAYMALMKALADAQIIQRGYYEASKNQKQSFVRPPKPQDAYNELMKDS